MRFFEDFEEGDTLQSRGRAITDKCTGRHELR